MAVTWKLIMSPHMASLLPTGQPAARWRRAVLDAQQGTHLAALGGEGGGGVRGDAVDGTAVVPAALCLAGRHRDLSRPPLRRLPQRPAQRDARRQPGHAHRS